MVVIMKKLILLLIISFNIHAGEIEDTAKEYIQLKGKTCLDVVGVNYTRHKDEIEIVCTNEVNRPKVRYVLNFKTGELLK
jgi:hypothetical protein